MCECADVRMLARPKPCWVCANEIQSAICNLQSEIRLIQSKDHSQFNIHLVDPAFKYFCHLVIMRFLGDDIYKLYIKRLYTRIGGCSGVMADILHVQVTD